MIIQLSANNCVLLNEDSSTYEVMKLDQKKTRAFNLQPKSQFLSPNKQFRFGELRFFKVREVVASADFRYSKEAFRG